jgi:hypothetical protein
LLVKDGCGEGARVAGSGDRVTWPPVREQYDHESSLRCKLQRLLLLNFAAFNRRRMFVCCVAKVHVVVSKRFSTWHVHKICKHIVLSNTGPI